MRPPAKLMRGFAIVSAIFILVVLGALGAFIVNVSTNQQIGSALDVQGVRAYHAARAGIEWGLYGVASSNGFNATTPNTRTCFASPTSFTPTAATLADFRITVTCNRFPVDDSPANNPNSSPAVYAITATACNQPDAGACPNATNPRSLYVERRLDVSF